MTPIFLNDGAHLARGGNERTDTSKLTPLASVPNGFHLNVGDLILLPVEQNTRAASIRIEGRILTRRKKLGGSFFMSFRL